MGEDEKGKSGPSGGSHRQYGEPVSIEEATRRDLERRRAAHERDKAMGLPEPPPGRPARRKRR